MAALKALREKAKKLSIPASQIRTADREELEALIEDASGNGKPKRKVAKKAVRKAVRKSTVAKKSSREKSAPARSRKSGTAKRQTTRTASKSNGNSGYVAKGGRNTLDGVDFSEHEDWNPRSGSAPDRIIKLLRKFRGNRTKVYEALLPDIGDFVKNKKSNGEAWPKGDGPGTRKGMLKYRISRTAWQFAVQTGQHEVADNRVEYGSGGTGSGIWKPAKKRNTAKATTKPKATRKPARKTATKAKAGRKSRRRTTRRK